MTIIQETGTLCIAGGNVKCITSMKKLSWFLKILNTELPYGPAIPTVWVYIQNNQKQGLNTLRFIAALFTVVKWLKIIQHLDRLMDE